MTQPIVYSRNEKLWTGMTMDDARNAVNNKTYRNEKAQNRAMDKAIIRFEKADKNNDGKLDLAEIEQYNKDVRKKNVKTALAITAGAAVAVAATYLATKGIKANKALTQELADTKTLLASTEDALKQSDGLLASTKEVLKQTDDVLKQTDDALNAARQQLGYGQGTIKAGDELLENAFEAQTKGGKAGFTLAKGDEVFPNVWDSKGGNYTPNKGDIIMSYGEVPKDWGISNPNVLKEMDEKGLTTYLDRAVSAEPDLMYKTYTTEAGRDFVTQPLTYDEKNVPAIKKIFGAGVAFDQPGKSVITLEAANGSGAPATLGVGQFVQTDINGNPYVKDVQDAIKRLDPKDGNETTKNVFAKLKEFIAQRKDINNSGMSDATKKTAIARAWENILEEIQKMA